MSEIRRKLVIVGDGACGKVITPYSLNDTDKTGADVCLYLVDLLVDSLFKRNLPRGELK
jgi:hypothetical protein